MTVLIEVSKNTEIKNLKTEMKKTRRNNAFIKMCDSKKSKLIKEQAV